MTNNNNEVKTTRIFVTLDEYNKNVNRFNAGLDTDHHTNDEQKRRFTQYLADGGTPKRKSNRRWSDGYKGSTICLGDLNPTMIQLLDTKSYVDNITISNCLYKSSKRGMSTTVGFVYEVDSSFLS